MEAEKHFIACTVMVKDEKDRLMFLVKKGKERHGFPTTYFKAKCTALACVIEELKKELLNLEVDYLELSELTNAVVHDNRIPFYVFYYEIPDSTKPSKIIKKDNEYEWVYYEDLVSTFNEWEISGVPLLSTE